MVEGKRLWRNQELCKCVSHVPILPLIKQHPVLCMTLPYYSFKLSPALRMAFLLLLLISATWLLGLMAVNSNVMTFHYLFAIFSCLQVRLCDLFIRNESTYLFFIKCSLLLTTGSSIAKYNFLIVFNRESSSSSSM